MLAKAGEGDRAIKTKMVRFSLVLNYILSCISPFFFLYTSPSICSQGNAKQGKHKEDDHHASVGAFPSFGLVGFIFFRCTLVRLSFTIASCIHALITVFLEIRRFDFQKSIMYLLTNTSYIRRGQTTSII